jgi:GNAT superfamily N-acetyltransferase
VLVEDAWQRRGIGRRLMVEAVDQARRRGVCTFIARILGDNYGALRFVAHSFPGARIGWEEGEYVVRLRLEEA